LNVIVTKPSAINFQQSVSSRFTSKLTADS
jgi:hypothetical protein